ncbi:MAG: amino acid ABC transporter permease [Chloroflexi bacterium]|nr:amino acid ABC transporter permease [Chloroflexota bacterium]
MTTSTEKVGEGRLFPAAGNLAKWPWWALTIALAAVLIVISILTTPVYQDAFNFISEGIVTTIRVTLTAYCMAIVGGLFLGLGRVSKNVIYYNFATLYVELMRGIPMLVIILYGAFVVVPLGLQIINGLGSWMVAFPPLAGLGNALQEVNIQQVDMSGRAIAGLAMGYAAFEAEVFRAGIQSIERGQMEAARSLGMNYVQAMRYVILPQAFRRVLPPLGNDFIAILKDSSLISVLAVRDITQLGKLYRARSFSSFEAYNTMAFLYLSMTISLSMLVKFIERKSGRGR